jgi:MFS transporter, DHA3 family, macrolide efflux protein
MQSASGMTTFLVIWFGQVVSLLGTSMTRFALLIWMWERTHEATAMVLVGVSASIPGLVFGLVAGTLVDRWDRRRVMMVSDLQAGLSTVAIFLLYTSGKLEVWHLYVASAVAGGVGTFQFLAYSAAVTTMLPKSQYARANGMISLAQYASVIGAPVLAGILLSRIGIQGILLIDVASFVFAVGALLFVHIPQPEATAESEAHSRLWSGAVYGFRYIFQRSGLLGLLLIYFTFALSESLAYPLIAPMILARTGNDEVILGTVQSVLGIGGVVGGVVMTVWGGPKRRIHGLLIGMALTALLGDALMGLGTGLLVWVIAAFFLEVFIPTMIGSAQSIWQSKVPPQVQGRVFAARSLVVSVAEPISMVIAGLLADRVLEPALSPTYGDGAGMAVMLVVGGVLSAVVALGAYLFRAVRSVEETLPDHDAGVMVSA